MVRSRTRLLDQARHWAVVALYLNALHDVIMAPVWSVLARFASRYCDVSLPSLALPSSFPTHAPYPLAVTELLGGVAGNKHRKAGAGAGSLIMPEGSSRL